MHLTYLLTCFNLRFLLNFFVNSRRFYLNKCCELKQRFLHVWHGTDQTLIDNANEEWHGRLRRFFAHVCGQKADTSSNYCDYIQPHDKRRFSFCQMCHDIQIVFFGFYHNFILLNFARQCGSILKVWQDVLYGFCWKFTCFPAVNEF